MITPEQARAELERRKAQKALPTITPEQARAELERRKQNQDVGIVRTIAGSLTKPFEKLGASALQYGGGAVAYGIDKVTPKFIRGYFNNPNKQTYSSFHDAIQKTGNPYEQGGFSITNKLTNEQIKPVKSVADLAGTSLEAASVVAPVVKAPAFLGKVFKGKVGAAALSGMTTAGASGFIGGAGRGLQEGKDVIGSIEQGVMDGAFAAPIGLALGGVGGSLVKVPKIATKTGRDNLKYTAAQESFSKDLDDVFSSTKSIQKTVKELQSKQVPLKEILSDFDVAKKIKVENKQIVVDDAIEEIQNNVNLAQNAKAKLLPEIDKYVKKTSKEELRNRAIQKVRGTQLEADEIDLINRINKQVDAMPDELSLVDVDSRRARAYTSSRDAKKQQKSDSEYTAIENALRDILFEKTDDLPIDSTGEIKNLNVYIKNNLAAKDFLDKSLRGQKVQGGKLGEYFARGIGAVAGSQGGVLGALAGSEIAGTVSKILSNNKLGSSIQMRLIRQAAEESGDPTVVKAAEELIEKLKLQPVLRLPAPSTNFKSQIPSKNTIKIGKSTFDEKGILRNQSLRPNMSLQNTANNTVMMNDNTSIPQTLPSNNSLSNNLSTSSLAEEMIQTANKQLEPIPRLPETVTPQLKQNISEIIDGFRSITRVSPQKMIELESDMSSIIENFGFALPRTKAAQIKLLELIYNDAI